MASMQTSFKTPTHKALQTHFLQKNSMPGFRQKYRFFGLNQVDFVKFQGVSGMEMALIEANGIILNLMSLLFINYIHLLQRFSSDLT